MDDLEYMGYDFEDYCPVCCSYDCLCDLDEEEIKELMNEMYEGE